MFRKQSQKPKKIRREIAKLLFMEFTIEQKIGIERAIRKKYSIQHISRSLDMEFTIEQKTNVEMIICKHYPNR